MTISRSDKEDTTYFQLTLREARAIYRIIEREWINRDDEDAMLVASRIAKIVKDNELDRKIS